MTSKFTAKKALTYCAPAFVAALISAISFAYSTFGYQPEIDALEAIESKYPICFGPIDGKLFAKIPIDQPECDSKYAEIMSARAATNAVVEKQGLALTVGELSGSAALIWGGSVIGIFMIISFVIPISSSIKRHLISKSVEIQIKRYKELKELGVLNEAEYEFKLAEERNKLL